MELTLDQAIVQRCRDLAASIVDPVSSFIAGHSTVAVERSVLRLLGVDGVGPDEVPVPNALVDALSAQERMRGVAIAFGRALAETGLDPRSLGDAFASGTYRFGDFDHVPEAAAHGALRPFVDAAVKRIRDRRTERNERLARLAQLPPLPTDWRPADPEQFAEFRRQKAK